MHRFTSLLHRGIACALLGALTLATGFVSGCAPAATSGSQEHAEELVVDVSLSGGSGRASVESPASVRQTDEGYVLTLVWSSSHYDLMVVDGSEITPVSREDGSTFELELDSLPDTISFQAETSAMGTPHLIDYTLAIDTASLRSAHDVEPTASQTSSDSSVDTVATFRDTDIGCDWESIEEVQLAHAKHFSVDRFPDGYTLVCISTGDRFLVVPEGASVPEGLSADIAVIQQPVSRAYLASSNTACLIDAIGAMDRVATTSVDRSTCATESLASAMDTGAIRYVGKYNTPDFEALTAIAADLAIENTMIGHSAETKEQIERLGIPVLMDLSSRESDVLGRLEWIKLFGVLFGEEDASQTFYDTAAAQVAEASSKTATGKTVAFFYINSNGAAVTRRSQDYIAQMMELAGGDYLFSELKGDDGSSSAAVTLEMEEFYSMAHDADVIIYNGTIDDGVSSLEELIQKNPLLEQFDAVQRGAVWVTDEDMYQQMTKSADIILELADVLRGGTGPYTYLRKVS